MTLQNLRDVHPRFETRTFLNEMSLQIDVEVEEDLRFNWVLLTVLMQIHPNSLRIVDTASLQRTVCTLIQVT